MKEINLIFIFILLLNCSSRDTKELKEMKEADAILLPEMFGEKSGKILKWKVVKGEKVRAGQILAELEMGNAVMELESYKSGKILYIEAEENEIINEGDLIAIIGEEGSDINSIIEKYNNPLQMFENKKSYMEGYLGEVRMYAGKNIPLNWKLCDGSRLEINEYQDLYRVINNNLSGEDASTFSLPDLKGITDVKYIICIKGKLAKD